MAEPMTQLSEKLRLAASKGQADCIRELSQSGARFTTDKYGRTALHYAANYGQFEAIKLCIHLGCELDTQDVYGCTALHRAVIDNHLDAVRALLMEGCAVDRQDENGNTALHEASWTGSDEIVMALVKLGKANLHAGNKHGNKPLHQSCQNGHNETTRILLRSGAHPNIKNNNGETPLHVAALFGHITCCRVLISASSNVNATSSEGNTPLHIAAGLGKKKISKILIDASSELNLKNNNGETALEVARKNDHAEVVLLILAAIKYQKSKSSHHHHHHHTHHHSKALDKPPTTSHEIEASKPVAAHHSKHKQSTDAVDRGQPSASRVRGRREQREHEAKEEEKKTVHAKKNSKERQKQTDKQNSLAKKPVSSIQHTTQKQVTFVREELKNTVLWEQQLHQQIHSVKLMKGHDKGHHHRRKHHQKCLYKDEKGQVKQGMTGNLCTCSIYIHKLQNQLEASKEKMLYEIETTRAQFQHKLGTLDKKLMHQGNCLDQLCKERVASERTECLHRIDRRMLQERALWSEEYERRLSYVREELRRYFEVRLKTVQQQLAVYYPSDARQPLHSNPSGFERISEGTEDSSGSDQDAELKSSVEVVGPSGKMIRRRKQSPSPSRMSRNASADERLRQNKMVRYMNAERAPEMHESGSYVESERGRSRMVIGTTQPRGRRTGSFTRAVQQQNASSADGVHEDESMGKELVSATYIPPIAHPDLPQTSYPREPESAKLVASFTFGTDSSSDESSSQSTISLETVSHRPVMSTHSDMQTLGSEGNTYTVESLSSSSNRPFQRLSKIALEQKAQYEQQRGHYTKAPGQYQDSVGQQSHNTSSWQQPKKGTDSGSTYEQLRHTSIQQSYGAASDADGKSLPGNQLSNQTSSISASPSSSSQYSPSQCQYSNSSSGVSSGDAATASSMRSRRDPIDDVLIRALSMEREKDMQSNSQEWVGTTNVDYPKDSKQSAYIRGFTKAEVHPSGYRQPTSSRKTHELQI